MDNKDREIEILNSLLDDLDDNTRDNIRKLIKAKKNKKSVIGEKISCKMGFSSIPNSAFLNFDNILKDFNMTEFENLSILKNNYKYDTAIKDPKYHCDKNNNSYAFTN